MRWARPASPGPTAQSSGSGRDGHRQRDEVTRGHGRRAAHDHERAEQVFDLLGRLRRARARATDHATEEPAGSVDTDEAHNAGTCGFANLGEQLRPEGTLALLHAAALAGDLRTNLLARLVPQARRTRRRERLHLQRRLGVVETDSDDALRLLFDLEAKVQALARQHLDATDVDVGANRVRLRRVEGATVGAVGRRRLLRLEVG